MNIRPDSTDPIGYIVRSKAGEGKRRYIADGALLSPAKTTRWASDCAEYTWAKVWRSRDVANTFIENVFRGRATRSRYEVVPV